MQKSDRTWTDRIASKQDRWQEQELARAHVSADPINPQMVFVSLNDRLPTNAIITGDAGTATNVTLATS